MDDDEAWKEVERMAQSATAADALIASQYPMPVTIDRWKHLFGYFHLEAVKLIGDQRGDGKPGYLRLPKLLPMASTLTWLVTRERITNDHWTLIREKKEALGYDREAYDHNLQLPNVFKSQSATIPTMGAETMLLFRLGGLLDTPEKVQEVAKLEELPSVKDGMSGIDIVRFCAVNQKAQRKLEEWLTQQAVLQN